MQGTIALRQDRSKVLRLEKSAPISFTMTIRLSEAVSHC